ncbi:ribbon-helix-helix protein, CopG family [Rhizobium sp. 32-5/1]|uniref:ribbon-helix-helix protein, CopG family n=1 Tax=Rhizobium sp. 32-5/1 TaxID=3019602 RepID=UPI00240D3A20|nr:ribbon-helix-helix protein, CopG family [Rhizobium sp. 32-5/1]WEZ81901.1 ribbon-helix-helix protein, CopG family [Rhizobium sp. 32-5/1]
MKTLIDIAEPQIKALEEIARTENRSRAAIIRAAIDDYLSRRANDNNGDAFGLWGIARSTGSTIRKRSVANGESPVRYQYPDRLPERNYRGAGRNPTL